MMKIAILNINNPFEKISGGIESYVYNLSQALIDIGHEVWVVCAGSGKQEVFKKEGKVNLWILPCNGKNLFTKSLRFAKYSRRIIHTLERKGVIIFNGQGGLSSPLSVLKPKNGSVFLTVHTLDGENIANIKDCARRRSFGELLAEIAKLLLVKTWRIFYLSRADYLIFVSKSVHTEFGKYYFFLDKKSYLIPNGYPTKIAKPVSRKEKYDFIYVGRLDKRKRVDWIVKATDELVKKQYRFSTSIIGIGPHRTHIATLIERLDVAKNISLLGYLPYEKAIEYISKSKFLILPSMYESDPLVIKEALSMGTPCIVSDIQSLTETIKDGENGFVFRGDHRQLSRSMEKALTLKRKDYERLSVSAGHSVKRISWQEIAKSYSRVYEESFTRHLI